MNVSGQSEFPVVPGSDGTVPSKHYMIQFFRRVILATGTPTTRHSMQKGRRLRDFRVTLYVFLANGLPPGDGISSGLLGRWGSAALERYLQMAPLLQVEHSAATLLHPQNGSRNRVRQDDLVAEGSPEDANRI